MKKQLKKWTFRLVFTACFFVGLLISFMLNPLLLYANKTVMGRYNVYHNSPLNAKFASILAQSDSIVRASELYDPRLVMNVCLKDGSAYPALIEKILGKDMLTSFYNKMVFTGNTINYEGNYIELDGHRWNLTQMLAHAEIHCLEFNRYGLFKANPLGGHPNWKWEGYPEYIARRPQDLQTSIGILIKAETTNKGWITLPDGTETRTLYQRYLLLVQYCIQVKKMSFVQLLADTATEETISRQMMNWRGTRHQ